MGLNLSLIREISSHRENATISHNRDRDIKSRLKKKVLNFAKIRKFRAYYTKPMCFTDVLARPSRQSSGRFCGTLIGSRGYP